MSDRPRDDRWMDEVADRATAFSMPTPSRFKAKLYSRLVEAQANSTGLAPLSQSSANGFGLCIFEKLVHIAPVGAAVETRNPCRVCHARVLAERLEHAPIYWPHCPYVQFQNR